MRVQRRVPAGTAVLLVNLLGADRPVTGVERYARELSPWLVATEPPGWSTRFIIASDTIEEAVNDWNIPRESLVPLPRLPLGLIGRHVSTQLLVPVAMRALRPALLFSPMNVGSLPVRQQVVMVHDLAWQRFPGAYRLSYRLLHRALTMGYRAHGITIACGSAAMRQELISTFPRARIQLLPYGPGRQPDPRSGTALRDPRRILWVGSRDPRKNLNLGVAACDEAARRLNLPLELVVAGRSPSSMQEPTPPPRGHHAKVRFVEPDDAALEELYATSRMLLCTSSYEGYGFAVSEALHRQLPVISSRIPAAEELRGLGVRIVDEMTASAFADAIVDELREPLARTSHLAAPTWEMSARRVWELMDVLSRVPARGGADVLPPM